MYFFKKFLTLFAVCLFVLSLTNITTQAKTEKQININSASVEALCQLDKVGTKYAQRIVDYREKNGPFEKPEDIMKVKGIGQKIFDANKDVIIVKDSNDITKVKSE